MFSPVQTQSMEEARGIRRQKAQPSCAWHCSDTPCPSTSPCVLRVVVGDLRRTQTIFADWHQPRPGGSVCGEQSKGRGRSRGPGSVRVLCIGRELPRVSSSSHLNAHFPHVFLYRNAVCLVRVLLAVAPEARGGGPCSVGCFLTLFLPLFQEKAVLMFSLPLLVPFPSPHQKVPPFPTAQSPPPPLSFLQVVR